MMKFDQFPFTSSFLHISLYCLLLPLGLALGLVSVLQSPAPRQYVFWYHNSMPAALIFDVLLVAESYPTSVRVLVPQLNTCGCDFRCVAGCRALPIRSTCSGTTTRYPLL